MGAVVGARGVNTMATADAIRGYVVTLRRGQKISQDTVAERSGLKRRAYILWETGISTDIKVPVLLNALEAVGGWAPHLYQLIDCTEEQGVELAEAWLELTPDERAAYRRLLTSNNGRAKLLRSVIKLSDDPELRGRAQGYLDSLLGR